MMEVTYLSISALREAPWNSNRADQEMLSKLEASIERYGLVENLVVRPIGDGTYEVLSGNQRLGILRGMGFHVVPCLVMELNDLEAMLLSQALNHIHGEDDLGKRAELFRWILEAVSQARVLELLPETAASLRVLAEMGQDTLADYLQVWERAQKAKLKHMTFHLTTSQEKVVKQALERVSDSDRLVDRESNPTKRGTALYLLCKLYVGDENQRSELS